MSKKPRKKSPVGNVHIWREVRDFIEQKYKISLSDYKGKFTKKSQGRDVEYCDFWHWMIALGHIHNGCKTYIPFDRLDPDVQKKYGKEPDWVLEILTLIKKEFAPKSGELAVWVDW